MRSALVNGRYGEGCSSSPDGEDIVVSGPKTMEPLSYALGGDDLFAGSLLIRKLLVFGLNWLLKLEVFPEIHVMKLS